VYPAVKQLLFQANRGYYHYTNPGVSGRGLVTNFLLGTKIINMQELKGTVNPKKKIL
jgi:hypothetical protein